MSKPSTDFPFWQELEVKVNPHGGWGFTLKLKLKIGFGKAERSIDCLSQVHPLKPSGKRINVTHLKGWIHSRPGASFSRSCDANHHPVFGASGELPADQL
jgi:hypothetical protein